jgi:undecaprenyl diphosphate synthase
MVTLEERTRDCCGLNLSIAIDYGGRDELTRAVRSLAADVATGGLAPGAISQATIAQALDTCGLPDPDLVIRTSGEFRISNFLLWQATYAEYDFPATAWPDFGVRELAEAVERYNRRERRFGEVQADAPRVAAGG